MAGGAVNQVYHYKSGYFKPADRALHEYSDKEMSRLSGDERSKVSGEQLTFRGGQVRHGRDKKGKLIDTHMDNRELAAARLDKLLGGNAGRCRSKAPA
ncbi:MAG: hypothetical protein IJU66_08530 [Oscillospiraceae bacterium]|nr:hypothetical protein [Oscillospiraceae bacterium]